MITLWPRSHGGQCSCKVICLGGLLVCCNVGHIQFPQVPTAQVDRTVKSIIELRGCWAFHLQVPCQLEAVQLPLFLCQLEAVQLLLFLCSCSCSQVLCRCTTQTLT